METFASTSRHLKVAKLKNAAWNCTFLRTELVFFRHIFFNFFFLFLWVSEKKSTLSLSVYLPLFSPMTMSFFFFRWSSSLKKNILLNPLAKSIESAAICERGKKCKGKLMAEKREKFAFCKRRKNLLFYKKIVSLCRSNIVESPTFDVQLTSRCTIAKAFKAILLNFSPMS